MLSYVAWDVPLLYGVIAWGRGREIDSYYLTPSTQTIDSQPTPSRQLPPPVNRLAGIETPLRYGESRHLNQWLFYAC